MIQAAFVDMQNMFDLLDVDPEVKNVFPLSIVVWSLRMFISTMSLKTYSEECIILG